MSIENNKRIARKFLEDVYGNWDIGLIDSMFHPEYSIVPHPILPKVESSLEGEKMMVKIFQIAFPDLKVTIKNMVAENDTVGLYWKATGTHTGNWFGAEGKGKKVSFRGSHYLQFYENKIKKISVVFDSLTLFVQVGQAIVKQREEIEIIEYLDAIKTSLNEND